MTLGEINTNQKFILSVERKRSLADRTSRKPDCER